MQLKFASYNIHKAVGADSVRDPERILSVLREIDADIVALQEVDRRFGRRQTVLPRSAVEDHGWQIAAPTMRPLSIGWHGNVMLVRRGIEVLEVEPVHLPMLEPRGAVRVELMVDHKPLCAVGMHLDLSGLRRRHQLQAVVEELGECGRDCPTVLMGDFNEWSLRGGSLRALGDGWQAIAPGKSFPSRRPLAPLDRIVFSHDWDPGDHGVHHSALSAQGSDHLPVWAEAVVPK